MILSHPVLPADLERSWNVSGTFPPRPARSARRRARAGLVGPHRPACRRSTAQPPPATSPGRASPGAAAVLPGAVRLRHGEPVGLEAHFASFDDDEEAEPEARDETTNPWRSASPRGRSCGEYQVSILSPPVEAALSSPNGSTHGHACRASCMSTPRIGSRDRVRFVRYKTAMSMDVLRTKEASSGGIPDAPGGTAGAVEVKREGAAQHHAATGSSRSDQGIEAGERAAVRDRLRTLSCGKPAIQVPSYLAFRHRKKMRRLCPRAPRDSSASAPQRNDRV
jgi:hypothetical protein